MASYPRRPVKFASQYRDIRRFYPFERTALLRIEEEKPRLKPVAVMDKRVLDDVVEDVFCRHCVVIQRRGPFDKRGMSPPSRLRLSWLSLRAVLRSRWQTQCKSGII